MLLTLDHWFPCFCLLKNGTFLFLQYEETNESFPNFASANLSELINFHFS